MTSIRIGSQPSVAPATPSAPASTPAAPATNAVRTSLNQDVAHFAAATSPTPLPGGQGDQAYDGAVLGGDGQAYPAGSIDGVPGFKPQNGATPNDTIVFVNGMGSSKSNDQHLCQQLANVSGAQVIGIDNATQGFVTDLLQSAGDILHTGSDKAVSSLSNVIYDKMMSGQPLHLMGFSQGAIITSRALTDAQNRMMLEGGMTQPQVQARMRELLKVETVAGAAPHFPDGPAYVHYLNSADGVERAVGLENPFCKEPGADAKLVKFSSGFSWNPFAGHDFDKYMSHYKPFDQAFGG